MGAWNDAILLDAYNCEYKIMGMQNSNQNWNFQKKIAYM